MKRIATRFSTLKRQITVLSTVIVCSLVSTSLAQTNASFPYGVASGDPYSDSVVLWTKFAPAGNSTTSQDVTWQISTSRTDFSSPVASGTFQATTENNFTVKLIAPGLQAGTEYFYRFTTNGAVSPVGRTKTLPTGSVNSVRLALFSCSNITADPFYAYDKVARKGDFDALVHVGDYIYEYGPGGYAVAESQAASVGFEPNGELLTLADYRARYAQYHRQNSLQSARASAPLIAIWDDHETANDAYKDGAQNHTEDTEGTWSDRVTAALQAYYEWMPIREPGSGNRKEAYRSFDFGNLVSLHMLETRLTGRDKQIALAPTSADVQARIGQILSNSTLTASYASTYGLTPPASQSDLPTFGAALATPVANELVYANVVEMYSGNRTLLGATQLEWLQNEMATSHATYQVLGQQVLMGNMVMPAELLLELAGGTVNPATIAKYLTPVAKMAAGMPFNSLNATEQAVYTNANALPYNEDAWDGYGKDRETILQTALELNKKLFVFSGDTHNAWSNQLKTMSPTSAGLAPQGTVAGIELATPGVSAPGIEKYFPGQEDILRQLFLGYSPGLKFANLANRGFLDVTFTPEKVLAKYYLKQTGAGQKDWKVQPIEIASATPTTLSINATTTEENDYRLQVLHASDMEADVVSLETAPRFAALVDKLEDSTEVDASVTIAAGDTFIPGAFLSAGNDATTKDSLKLALGQLFGFNANGTATDLRESAGRPDIAILNAIGFDASCIGNHEFDLGSTEFASIILPDVRSGGLSKLRHYGASFPYLSANLDFSAVPSTESALAARTTSASLPVFRFRANPSTDSTYVSTNATHIAQHPKIAKSAIIERGTQKIGVLGVTPPDLANISSPGRVVVTGPQGATLTSPRTYDLNALAAHLQPVIDDLKSNGCNKIILATQLQQIENEKGLASKLDGVDIIVAGGSGTIYANDSANLLPGDTAAGTYPYLTTDKGNRTVAVVSTDGQYQYLGRLLVDFNANGEIVGTGGDTIPATAAKVTSVWGSDSNNAYAAGTRGGTVKALTDAVGAVINSKDGLILGRSSVYLEGRRTAVRQQETNFGNLSADANLWYAKQYDATTRVSLKNGGGIRNAIGSTSANGTLQPTKANLTANKTAGDISRLDVEDSLKFNNALTVLTVKASQLKMLLEHGVAGSNGSGADKNTPGQFSQLGGLVAAADLSRTAQTYTSSNNVISAVNAGERIRYVALTDAQGNPTDVIVANGQVLEPERLIRMVTLNFLANAGSNGSDFGGDNYPFPYISRVNGVESYDRKDLNSGTLIPALPGNFPALSTFAGNGTEQDAFAEYLLTFHSTTPFGTSDKTVDLDRRISQITPGSAPQIDAIPKAAVAQAGVPFSYLLTAGNYATAFSSSTLPSWLTLNSTTGLLSGTPPAWGVEDLIVTASNGNGTDTETLRINLRAEDNVFQTIKFLGGASLPTGGEIVDYANGKVLTTNSGNVTHKVEILTVSSSGALAGNSTSVDLASVFGGAQNINSISSVLADQRGFGVATVIPKGTGAADLGRIAIFNIETGAILKTLDVGYHPDSVTITPDGTKLVVVNEGEYGSTNSTIAESVSRPGSISIVDISSVTTPAHAGNLTQSKVTTIDFSSANLATGVSIAGLRNARLDTLTTKTANLADIEPEYATATNTKAYITLQENNAIAVFDFATSKYSAIFELGTIEQLIDASDRDGANSTTSIAINDSVHGLPMPDTIANFSRSGSVFLLTANEGDARPDDADIARGSTLTANMTSAVAATATNTGIGRLNLLRFEGDDNNDGKIELPTMMGTRSFTIWNSSNGSLVYDSGSTLEMFAAANDSETFNTNSGSLSNTDTRSDDKGPEPEAIAYASLGGRHYAFVGAERQNGIYAFDITNFSKVKVVGYFNTISSTQDSGAAYISPESIKFIRAGTNPSDKNLLVVGYEGTGNNGSVAVFEFAPPASSEPEPEPEPTPAPTPTRPVPLAQKPVSSATTREEVKAIVSSKVQEALAKNPVKVKTTGQIAEILGVSKGTLSKIAKLAPGLKTEGGKINIAKLEKLIRNNPKAAALLTGNAKIQGGSKKSTAKK